MINSPPFLPLTLNIHGPATHKLYCQTCHLILPKPAEPINP